MKRYSTAFFFLLVFVGVSAQQDTITISAKVAENSKLVSVNQEIIYFNNTALPLKKIKLLNWVSAYQKRNTPLLKRTLQNRESELYFANPEELGNTTELQIKINSSDWEYLSGNDENIYYPLYQELKPGESIKIFLKYNLHLPDEKFTTYGIGEKQFSLKYFFIVPDAFEDENQSPKYYRNIEENQSPGNYWKINFELPTYYFADSNLERTQGNSFEGKLNKDPEFLISKKINDRITTQIDGQKIEIDFGYSLTATEKQNLEFYLPLQLHFIKNKIGNLPNKIFISEKFRKDEDFTGIDDLKFWKFHYKLFKDSEQTDLNYFSILSKAIVQRTVIFNKSNDHWLMNGLKTYLEIQYLDRYYKDRKLLGDLPDEFKFFGLKPLKIFQLSKLQLNERYGLAYQYIVAQNLDQKISEPFEDLSNFNASAISHFEMGSLFSFIAEKMGQENFDDFLMHYFTQYSGKSVDQKVFLDELSLASGYSSDFLEHFIEQKNRVNIKLKRYRKLGDDFQVKVIKNTTQTIPFKIETEEKSGGKQTFWFDTDDSKKVVDYNIPQSNAEKIVINDNYIFPEINFRDNYLYTKGFFANTKKIKLKVFKDIPNPEYNEIYVNPRLNFNAYDKVLFGINFKNASLFDRKLQYSFTPYFSSGTGQLAGSGGVAYSFQPANSFYRSLDFGVSASHFHYDYDLTYRKIGTFVGINFAKDPRSDIGRSIGFSYNYLEKDLDPTKITTEYGKYNLWNLGYGYSDRTLIHERSMNANFQWMEDFQKISTELSYRWEFAEDKKISMRFFGGYFITNNTKNSLFNYGISRVSNYAFSYGLLGQSATSGLFAQQLIVAEGGFKSYLGTTANQWITAVNVDSHVWRWFNVYADAGVYKNKNKNAEFIWDSGVKVKVIPDFLEVYFPIQSSLGFEPSFKDYGQRIRFTLVLNFNAITGYFRRGWF
ncbi:MULTISPECIES: aminopeptidase [unclassified Kaistella]|uniref:aminopeptidase n=1 Tax=unclassified Kaistella TaxID=2762626 RepID=UPI00273331EF|nr:MULTISPECIES: aminopeptidase [unclassified Kaistella]MDP2453550.1 aminopeptidase [Kaistella sp. SH11-4b]MDP2456607.1 aminopeptidase [Kaistella sp. SH40-3]MDP2459363.1 aminopeptidase [Kaistella sp. SH19-2b]